MSFVQPACRGEGCPIKMTCYHYRDGVQIDFKKEQYFSRVPYNRKTNKCEFYFGLMENNLLNGIKDLLDGRKKDKED